MDEKGARAGAGCRGRLHSAVSPGIGGCERRGRSPSHPPAALLPASLRLSMAFCRESGLVTGTWCKAGQQTAGLSNPRAWR